MANKTLHIRPCDEPLWAAAGRVARRDKTSLYAVLTEALEAHLPAVAAGPSRSERWAQIAPADETATD